MQPLAKRRQRPFFSQKKPQVVEKVFRVRRAGRDNENRPGILFSDQG